MRILHFHFGKEGGAERFFVALVNAFHRRGVEQRIFMRPGRSWEDAVSRCGPVYLGAYRHVSLSRFLVAARVRRVIREFAPDVVMAWAPQASRLLPRAAPGLKVSRLGDFPQRLDYFKNTDIIVCNTPDIAERVKELGWQRRVEVISNFTEVGGSAPVDRAALSTPEDAFLVVGLGRFVKRKGFHTLIDAVARLPDTWLWLVGEGEERAALERQAAEAGITDRVRFVGWQAKPGPYLAAGDVFVMPSNHEPLGNVILEAWALKKPVVSSRAEGPLWMMTDGEDGLLVDIDDDEGFAAALARIKNSPELARKLVAGGQKTLAERFSADGVTAAYFRLFTERQSAS